MSKVIPNRMYYVRSNGEARLKLQAKNTFGDDSQLYFTSKVHAASHSSVMHYANNPFTRSLFLDTNYGLSTATDTSSYNGTAAKECPFCALFSMSLSQKPFHKAACERRLEPKLGHIVYTPQNVTTSSEGNQGKGCFAFRQRQHVCKKIKLYLKRVRFNQP